VEELEESVAITLLEIVFRVCYKIPHNPSAHTSSRYTYDKACSLQFPLWPITIGFTFLGRTLPLGLVGMLSSILTYGHDSNVIDDDDDGWLISRSCAC
jgi:hypothetical protein